MIFGSAKLNQELARVHFRRERVSRCDCAGGSVTIEVDFDYLAVFKQRLLGMCNTTYQWGPWNASNFVVSNIEAYS